jgi:hypothetical protein
MWHVNASSVTGPANWCCTHVWCVDTHAVQVAALLTGILQWREAALLRAVDVILAAFIRVPMLVWY